jgi:hypothetical protein
MADLGHVKLMRADRLGGEDLRAAHAAGPGLAAEPAGDAAEHEGGDNSRNRQKRPPAIDAPQAIDVEPRRNWFLCNPGVARVDQIRLRLPRGDARGILRMRGKPGFDRRAALGRQLAVHIGVQLGFQDRRITVDHRLALLT